MSRGRPPKAGVRHTARIVLTLWEGEDDDLIEFFKNLSPGTRAAAVKQALRAGGIIADEDPQEEEDVEYFNLDDFLA